MRILHSIIALVVAAFATLPLAAQTVRGSVVDAEARPVPGMLVSLHGPEGGATLSGGLTGADGRFALRAPGAGRYTVRAERIGYRRVEAPVEVVAGVDAEVRLTTSVQAFVLAPLRVESDARCVVRPGAGLQAYELWQQAATALRATAVAQEQQLVQYTVRTYTSEWTGLRRERHRDPPRQVTGNPFQTLSPADLARRGYLREDEETFEFYGPDARVLLSDHFLDTHCLFVQTEGGERGHVGVGFEPVAGRAPVDIRGTLWLDARTGELRFVEYEYTGLPGGSPMFPSGGRIEFQRQRSGAWVVSRWHIRSAWVPTTEPPGPGQVRIAVVTQVREAGGRVTDVRVRPANAQP